jgi:hypothetical protein
MLSSPLTVEDHFAVAARVVTVSVNTEDDFSVPAAPEEEPTTFVTWSNIEADRPVRPQEVVFGGLAAPEGRWENANSSAGAWRYEAAALAAHRVLSTPRVSHGYPDMPSRW